MFACWVLLFLVCSDNQDRESSQNSRHFQKPHLQVHIRIVNHLSGNSIDSNLRLCHNSGASFWKIKRCYASFISNLVLSDGRNASVTTRKPLFFSVTMRKQALPLRGISVVTTICQSEKFRKHQNTEMACFPSLWFKLLFRSFLCLTAGVVYSSYSRWNKLINLL